VVPQQAIDSTLTARRSAAITELGRLLELLGRSEGHLLAGTDLHGLAGCRIATGACFTLADF
jgi:hypothetical protein